jgi:hypothetical protein
MTAQEPIAGINDRDATILIIRRELRRRSGKTWSVKGGRGTAWGWITIGVPPSRRDELGFMTETERAELAVLLGLTDRLVHRQGLDIPADTTYRIEYVDRARGLAPASHGTPYWD